MLINARGKRKHKTQTGVKQCFATNYDKIKAAGFYGDIDNRDHRIKGANGLLDFEIFSCALDVDYSSSGVTILDREKNDNYQDYIIGKAETIKYRDVSDCQFIGPVNDISIDRISLSSLGSDSVANALIIDAEQLGIQGNVIKRFHTLGSFEDVIRASVINYANEHNQIIVPTYYLKKGTEYIGINGIELHSALNKSWVIEGYLIRKYKNPIVVETFNQQQTSADGSTSALNRMLAHSNVPLTSSGVLESVSFELLGIILSYSRFGVKYKFAALNHQSFNKLDFAGFPLICIGEGGILEPSGYYLSDILLSQDVVTEDRSSNFRAEAKKILNNSISEFMPKFKLSFSANDNEKIASLKLEMDSSKPVIAWLFSANRCYVDSVVSSLYGGNGAAMTGGLSVAVVQNMSRFVNTEPICCYVPTANDPLIKQLEDGHTSGIVFYQEHNMFITSRVAGGPREQLYIVCDEKQSVGTYVMRVKNGDGFIYKLISDRFTDFKSDIPFQEGQVSIELKGNYRKEAIKPSII